MKYYDYALIHGDVKSSSRWHVKWERADPFSSNKTCPKSFWGYPIHAHCWMLLDRFMGHGLLMQNLGLFVQALQRYWGEHKTEWGFAYMCPRTTGHREDYSKWVRKLRVGATDQHNCRTHFPGNPFRIPAIQTLVSQFSRDADTDRQVSSAFSFMNILPEIAMMIVDTIYECHPPSIERINDIRNMLEAFGWVLPTSYWTSRFNPEIFFEIDDLINSRKDINLPNLVLGLEEIMLDEDWFCKSGLYNRGRILKLISGIKEHFLQLLESENNKTASDQDIDLAL
ncbi:uncharacterized protein LDX57_010373 [Aspergillus melleus]|uniref:uncharacterized protein n=1 Tax=Aspergillus melleus TaxID=138277 RepID=UPI001E8DD03E|nr:uncharacterized protein LDX57_010373 [Aspergillus melleus]KAH8432746.1 hypothetical protein LDX57_010373 [Aspergillus melleus]